MITRTGRVGQADWAEAVRARKGVASAAAALVNTLRRLGTNA